jgi:alpha-1,3-rhamnosyl/mannosyltransferase
LPLFYNGPSVITVHDLSIITHPEWFPGFKFFLRKVLIPQSIKKAKKIIAVSEYTKEQIKKIFQVTEEKIEVIYEGAARSRQIAARYLPGSYLAAIGTIEPRKNFIRMLEAFEKLSREYPKLKFLLAGGRGWKNEAICKKIESLKPSVEYLGYVSEGEKYHLLKNALALVFVSLEEGFGLPLVEAMASGIPIITSNTSALKEISEGAALQADPKSVGEIYKAMKRVVEDPKLRADLIAKSLERAGKFSWQECARKTLELYKQLYK